LAPIPLLALIASGAVGGGSTHLRALLSGLDRTRFTPTVACGDDGPLADVLRTMGIPVLALRLVEGFGWRAWPALDAWIARHHPAFLHAHGTRAALFASMLARRHRVPWLYTVHGWTCHPRPTPGATWLARHLERGLAHSADHVVCVSAADHALGLRHGLLVPGQVSVVPNGIDPTAFAPDPAARERRRGELGLGSTDRLVSLFGRLTRQKAPEVFLAAARRIDDPDVRFALFGDGPDRPWLEGLARQWGLTARVVFAGFVAEVAEYLSASDCFVLPSRWEGLPIALLEAMATGVPVIASRVGGSSEVIEDGACGLLVAPDSPEALAAAIRSLLDHPEYARRLAQRAQDRVRERYGLATMVAATADCYRRLVGVAGEGGGRAGYLG